MDAYSASWRRTSIISMAVSAASYPLLASLEPARSMACSTLFVVKTPKPMGIRSHFPTDANCSSVALRRLRMGNNEACGFNCRREAFRNRTSPAFQSRNPEISNWTSSSVGSSRPIGDFGISALKCRTRPILKFPMSSCRRGL